VPENGILLTCDTVTKRYGALVAVNKMSFDLARGEVLGIGGPNGAGKTTLFDLIAGSVPADDGKIIFDGQIVSGSRPYVVCHRGLARTFQLNAAFETLTVFENVYAAAHFGRPHAILSSLKVNSEAASYADEQIHFSGLSDRRHSLAGNLSVLDKKRLMVAGALATRPECLLLDEPVGGLTPREIDEILELVKLIQTRGISVIVIEHVMRFLVTVADRLLIMHHGERLFLGSPTDMANDDQVIETYLGRRVSARVREFLKKK
jgi:ABC-type branched-subunit amino acid transport system ATPase component